MQYFGYRNVNKAFVYIRTVPHLRNGEEFKPKTTRQNRYTSISEFAFCAFFNHKNRKQSLSILSTSTFKNAFSISAIKAILFCRKRTKISKSNGLSDGPTCKQSLKTHLFHCRLWQRHRIQYAVSS
jgi:hypothetical protein